MSPSDRSAAKEDRPCETTIPILKDPATLAVAGSAMPLEGESERKSVLNVSMQPLVPGRRSTDSLAARPVSGYGFGDTL